MVNRVALGSARSSMGLFVSKPGFDVLTCTDMDLLLSTDFTYVDVVQIGTLNFSTFKTTLADTTNDALWTANKGYPLNITWSFSFVPKVLINIYTTDGSLISQAIQNVDAIRCRVESSTTQGKFRMLWRPTDSTGFTVWQKLRVKYALLRIP